MTRNWWLPRQLAPRMLAPAVAAMGAASGVIGGDAAQAGASTTASTPTTVVTTSARITAFAQDGRRYAWIEERPCGYVVVQSTAAAGRRRDASRCSEGDASVGPVAVAGPLVAWVVGYGAHPRHNQIVLADAGSRPELVADHTIDGTGGGGESVRDLRGDSRVVVYSVDYEACIEVPEGSGCQSYCDRRVGGELVRVTGRTAQYVFRGAGTATLALSGNRVATVPATAHGLACHEDPDWSPDGRHVAFSSRRDGPDDELYVLNVDTGVVQQLTNNDVADVEPEWSPDGTKLAFVRREDPQPGLYVITRAGSAERRVGTGREPAWAPDGRRFAVTTSGGIAILDADSGAVERLVGTGSQPTWSPNGSRLAFTRASGIFVVDSSGGERRIVTGDSAAWSPDGRELAFMASLPDHGREVFTIEIATGATRRLTDNALNEARPDWSTLNELVVAADGPRSRDLHLISADGGERRLTDTKTTRGARGPIRIRDVSTGRPTAEIRITGTASAIALTRTFAAVLIRAAGRSSIAVFDAATGRRRGGISVPRTTAPELSASEGRVVFRSGRSIRMLDTRTMGVTRVTTAGATPIGLSIEGRRVAWAEAGARRSHVRALLLPVRD